jgi:type IV pilus assembly protein PilY1
MKTSQPIRSVVLAAVMLLSAQAAQAVSPITLPTAPLYLAGGVAPNLVVTLDDSGSMSWGFVPDSMGKNAKVNGTCYDSYIFKDYDGDSTKRYFVSGDYNAQYYNPTIIYLQPLKADGTPFTTSYSAAYVNGFDTTSTAVNLASDYQPPFGFQPQSHLCNAEHPAIDSGTGKQFSTDETKGPAYYYRYDTNAAGCSGSKTDEACYVYTAVGAAEQQNFANWYSFYRTRNLATVSAATRAFNNLPGTMRLAWQSLSSCNTFGTSCQGWDGVSKDNRIRILSESTHKQDFYNWLTKLPAAGSTPLRVALAKAGQYYSTTSGTDNPYAQTPQSTLGTEYSCRANYAIVMTDGMWNGDAASTVNSNVAGNLDNTPISLPDGTSYTAPAPFADSNSDSLADVAFYYWATDLRTDLTNNVPRSPRSLDQVVNAGKTIASTDYFNAKNDPASWQHMVTYTVGLGMTTTFPTLSPALTWGGDTYSGSYADLASGNTKWPATGADNPGNVADLWHAALNGRGLFFSAEDPKSLSDAMQAMVNNIISRTSSAAAIATNSRRLDTTTTIYQASYDSGSWTGELEAFKVNADGTLGASQWKASTQIPAAASRNIWTFNGTSGATFTWDGISTAQQTALGSADVLNYLRGDQSKEQSACGDATTCRFRNRTSLLGDIIDSDPLFVSTDNFGYDKLSGTEGTDYVTYMAGKSTKTPVIYVGANDGMLHAIKASDGSELFTYVPALAYANLAALSSPAYSHQYYVDGAPVASDVYYGGVAWKTVLVTPMGAGARGLFALDITNPDTAFASSNVLWEFDGSSVGHASDMGYPVGNAAIGRFNDGKYYAVFGNGYGSVNCQSGLFMVQVDNPSNVKYFGTGTGSCTSTATQNGMSPPSLVDYNGDRIIDAIYAGDLLGNLWKFDVSTGSWGIALTGNKPLFTTASGQAITAPVEVGKVPSGATGVAMVYFGTGRYLLPGDVADTTKQTFYGLLDNNSVITSSKLQAQSIVYESATARVVSSNTVNWASQSGWKLDMVPPSGTLQGERVLSAPLLRFGRVIFNTSIPSSDPCVMGGTGWLMELDAATGSNLGYSALDMNNDGLFNSSDYVTYTDKTGKKVTSPVAGKKLSSMSLNQPTVITAGSKEFKFNSDINKGISVVTEKSGTSSPRSSWRQIQ